MVHGLPPHLLGSPQQIHHPFLQKLTMTISFLTFVTSMIDLFQSEHQSLMGVPQLALAWHELGANSLL